MTAEKTITDLLAAPLSPDWTVEGLAEQLLGSIAAQGAEDTHDVVLDADSTSDRQARRLLRPLLACLAIKSAAEAGTAANLYGGHLSFQRQSSKGPVWVLGHFENRPGNVRVALRRTDSPPERSASQDEHSTSLSETRSQLQPQNGGLVTKRDMEQKLVSIFLTGDEGKKAAVQEHLQEYLARGWKVKQMESLGADAAEAMHSRDRNNESWSGWLIVLLERAESGAAQGAAR